MVNVDEDDPERWQFEFGTRLRVLRLEAGLSQMELAHLVGLHPTYISSVERGGRNISLVNIRALAQALGAPPSAFFA